MALSNIVHIARVATAAGLIGLASLTPVMARQASIVVDANSGEVAHESQADAPRFPASLTKVMTLYMLFEQIEAGRLSMNSRLEVSAEAARQPPTKLGLRPGSTIRVEDAVQALITRSANDVAVVVAESIAGSEEDFAERMTRRARQIGMSRTTFRNASGLPNMEQRTTARDMALLGRAIYERFPQYARYFGRSSFRYGNRNIRNHNRLIGRVQGVDGIKTGYTRASGFNLITSVRHNGRHMVAVVMGGRTARARDAQMARLVAGHMSEMAARRTDFSVAQRVRGRGAEPVAVARADTSERPVALARVAAPAQAEAPTPAPRREPASPPAAATPAPVQTAAAAVPVPTPRGEAAVAERREISTAQPVRTASAAGPVLQWRTGAQPAAPAAAMATNPAPQVAASVSNREPTAAQQALTGWVVQIAATNTEQDAQRMLTQARESVGRPLAGARLVTERVQRGNATLFRARFAGFADRGAAEAACAALKRGDYDCMAIRL